MVGQFQMFFFQELLKILYTDAEYTNLLDVEFNAAGKTDKTDTAHGEKKGVRALKVSPDGQHLATGDRQGNIRIYDLQFADQLQMLEAHESEILCLEYTKPKTGS
jgi:WD40 repeat protein